MYKKNDHHLDVIVLQGCSSFTCAIHEGRCERIMTIANT